jgi:hypothetical protein
MDPPDSSEQNAQGRSLWLAHAAKGYALKTSAKRGNARWLMVDS